jgi:hypothetical protein
MEIFSLNFHFKCRDSLRKNLKFPLYAGAGFYNFHTRCSFIPRKKSSHIPPSTEKCQKEFLCDFSLLSAVVFRCRNRTRFVFLKWKREGKEWVVVGGDTSKCRSEWELMWNLYISSASLFITIILLYNKKNENVGRREGKKASVTI